MASEVFESTQNKDNELRVEVSKARERVAANPDDHDAQIVLVNVCEEGRKLWESCERELSRLDQATTDGEEHAMFVREINLARNIAKGYGTEAASASNAAENTPKSAGSFKMGTKKPKESKKESKNQQEKQKAPLDDLPPWARIAIAVVAIVFLISVLGRPSKKSEKAEESTQETAVEEVASEPAPEPEQAPAPEPEPAPTPEPAKQVFDSDFGTLEYRNIQDAVGNAVVSFMYTNKTDVTISGYAENLVVNNQFNVQALGGVTSLSGIDAGNSGAVGITFGVPTQTTLESVSEITSLSGDFRVYPKDSVTETIGYIHFDVVV